MNNLKSIDYRLRSNQKELTIVQGIKTEYMLRNSLDRLSSVVHSNENLLIRDKFHLRVDLRENDQSLQEIKNTQQER